ncbi:serine-type D-Ala-D-Ala carboxypeptidase (penicillin-binding protein 5/6) [Alphaproteobacteria bacterium]
MLYKISNRIISQCFCIAFLLIAVVSNRLSFATDNESNTGILDSPSYAAIIVNADTFEILYSRNAQDLRYPASLIKMMTLYLTFDALEKGKLCLKQKILMSQTASQQPKSNLDLAPKDKISVRDAIYSIIVKSANDVSYAIAEAIGGGSVDKFVSMMNNKARQLGLKNTRFMNPNGLHHELQVTTAHDMARLALALQVHFPQYYHLFSTPFFKFRGKTILSHNHILKMYKDADGLKTGFTNASGFNLVTSARRPEGRLIGVVLGGQTARIRDVHMVELLQVAYGKLHTKYYKKKFDSGVTTQSSTMMLSTLYDSIDTKKRSIPHMHLQKEDSIFKVINNNAAFERHDAPIQRLISSVTVKQKIANGKKTKQNKFTITAHKTLGKHPDKLPKQYFLAKR